MNKLDTVIVFLNFFSVEKENFMEKNYKIKVLEAKKDSDLLFKIVEHENEVFGEATVGNWNIKPFTKYGKVFAMVTNDENEELMSVIEVLSSFDRELAYVYGVSTVPKFERNGYARILLKYVLKFLKELGIKNIVMMTGDNERTAKAVAAKIGVDKYYAEVLPEDKARFVEKEKEKGRKVIMVGDGINDSPALSAADCGIAISGGAELAREIADITIVADNLNELVKLKTLSNLLMKRINSNYRKIVGINGGLIGLGVFGVVQPATSALVHNLSTLAIGLSSTTNLME